MFRTTNRGGSSFQFLGIPPKGEPDCCSCLRRLLCAWFPISRDPPEGGTLQLQLVRSRTSSGFQFLGIPPKGEPVKILSLLNSQNRCFQFLGIPPKGEPRTTTGVPTVIGGCFQFLGIPPKGEPGRLAKKPKSCASSLFPISRDPPEGGTRKG